MKGGAGGLNPFSASGDGEIDVDEYEYVLGNFGVKSKDARVAFMMFSMVSMLCL